MLVKAVALEKCRRFKDFGRGFYCTCIESQAVDWAKVIAARNDSGVAIVNIFEFDSNKAMALQHLRFEAATVEWAYFIMNNRNPRFNMTSGGQHNHDNRYDVVEGPVADDNIAAVLDQFMMNLKSGEALAEALEYRKLNHQISFHTPAALELLTWTGFSYV